MVVVELLLLMSPFMAAAQDSRTLETEQAIVQVRLEGAYPDSWMVAPLGNASEFVSLVNGDSNTPMARPFRLLLDGDSGALTDFANSTAYDVNSDNGAIIFTSSVHESGLQIIKRYQLLDKYTAKLAVTLRNALSGNVVALGSPALTLGPGIGRTPETVGGLGDAMYRFVEAVSYDGQGVLTIEADGDPADAIWAGIHDRYYAFLVRPTGGFTPGTVATLTTKVIRTPDASDPNSDYYPELQISVASHTSIAPGEELVFEFDVYAGPKDRTALTESGYAPLLYSNLPGPLRWLCLQLGDLLRFMYGHIGSWWMTIVAFTIMIRIVLFPLAQKSINMNAKMMADQAKLKPLIDEIKGKYKNAQTQYDKTMALYKEHGINPLAPLFGCLPVLLQLPILIAIFNILGQEVTLQGARFLWIDDLSLPDRLFPLGVTLPYFGAYFNLLPVLMAVTMVLTTNLGSPADGDQKKSQTRSMAVLAFIFFALFYSFPAGLVLYWMLSNLGQYVQQVITTRITARRASILAEDATPGDGAV